MICSICGFVNEDGVSYCEKCKSDLEYKSDSQTDRADSVMPSSKDQIASEHIVPSDAIKIPEEVHPWDREVTEQTMPITLAPASSPPPDIPTAKFDEVAAPVSTTSEASSTSRTPILVAVRGEKMDKKYKLYPGPNYLGRTDDKPVDIDLDEQESPDRIWCSRQHAVIHFDNNTLSIEDLNSLNGTFVNRTRVHPGQKKELNENDVVQIGTVHLKVTFG